MSPHEPVRLQLRSGVPAQPASHTPTTLLVPDPDAAHVPRLSYDAGHMIPVNMMSDRESAARARTGTGV